MATLRDLFDLDLALADMCIETEKKGIYQDAVDQAFAYIESEVCIPGLFDYDVDEEISLVYSDKDGACWERSCGTFPTIYNIGMWRSITNVEFRRKDIGGIFNDVANGWVNICNGDYCYGTADFNIKRPTNEAVPTGPSEYVRPVTSLERPDGQCCTCGFFPNCSEIRISGYYGFRTMPREFNQIINDCLKLALICEKQVTALSGSGGSSTSTSGEQEVKTFIKSEKTHTKTTVYDNVVLDGPSSSSSTYSYSSALTSDSNKNILTKYSICKCYSL